VEELVANKPIYVGGVIEAEYPKRIIKTNRGGPNSTQEAGMSLTGHVRGGLVRLGLSEAVRGNPGHQPIGGGGKGVPG
jgi:hypothetical protein